MKRIFLPRAEADAKLVNASDPELVRTEDLKAATQGLVGTEYLNESKRQATFPTTDIIFKDLAFNRFTGLNQISRSDSAAKIHDYRVKRRNNPIEHH